MADAEEGPKQEFAAGLAAVLRASPDRIVTPDGYSKFAEIKKCDRTDKTYHGASSVGVTYRTWPTLVQVSVGTPFYLS